MPLDRDDDGTGDIDETYQLPLSPSERDALMWTVKSPYGEWTPTNDGRMFGDAYIVAENDTHYLLAKFRNGGWRGEIQECSHVERMLDDAWKAAINKSPRQSRRRFLYGAIIAVVGTTSAYRFYDILSSPTAAVFKGVTENECNALGIFADGNGMRYKNRFAEGMLGGPITIAKENGEIRISNTDGQMLIMDLDGDPIWYISGCGALPMPLGKMRVNEPR